MNLGFKVTNLNSIPRETALLNLVSKEDAGNTRALSPLPSAAKRVKNVGFALAT